MHARRAVIIAALLAAALAIAARAQRPAAATGERQITPEIRAAGLRFDAVGSHDRAWILAAITAARPEARRLIDEVDGVVKVRTDLHGVDHAIGMARLRDGQAEISLDVQALDGDRAIDRNVVVLHELGHVIDYLLVDDELVRRLDAGIPPAGPCRSASEDFGPCTAIQERFADTFAKWALRGRFSLAGSGYGIPTPRSLEDWGSPLSRLATELDVRARAA